MSRSIIHDLKKIWDSWNIQGFIILSFCVQFFLVLFAPFRKRTSNMLVGLSIWAAYMLADWVAGFAVGLIASRQRYGKIPKEEEGLIALWASVLLLHIGGPDTITAFSLEDNELWRRQLFGLAAQIMAAGYIFSQTLPHNKLWFPTLLLFAAGIIKYFQRIRALHVASKDKFRKSASFGYEDKSRTLEELETKIFLLNIAELDMVRYAKRFHDSMKGILVNVPFDSDIRDANREIFLDQSPEWVLQVLATELNLIYDTFFTKMVVVHGLGGLILLSASFTSGAVALAWLCFVAEKWAPEESDRPITYTLLLGSLILDSVALLMLIFSDWTAAKLNVKNTRMCNIKIRLLDAFYWKWKPCYSLSGKDEVLATPVLFRRWSESVSGFNLVAYCLNQRPKRIQKPRRISGFFIEEVIRKPFELLDSLLSRCFFSLGNIFDKEKCKTCFCFKFLRNISNKAKGTRCIEKVIYKLQKSDAVMAMRKWIYSSNDPLKKELWMFIFSELKGKHNYIILPEEALEMCSARGELAIQNWEFSPEMSHVRKALSDSVTKIEFYHSILLWHLATDMCYYKEGDANITYESTGRHYNDATQNEISFSDNDCRIFSKNISDYIMYLLVTRPDLTPPVNLALTEKFIELAIDHLQKLLSPEDQNVESACKKLFDEENFDEGYLHPIGLARKLNSVENKWVLISKVWVEMLSYAAIHCDASAHIRQLTWGGELVGFVWLLMAHLGFINPSLLPMLEGKPYWFFDFDNL